MDSLKQFSLDAMKKVSLDTMKRAGVVGAIVIGTALGMTILWPHSKDTPPGALPTAANASPVPAVAAVAEPPAVTLVSAAPWEASEPDHRKTRDSARDAALKSLGLPMATFCKAEARRKLIGTLGNYLAQRDMQQRQYAANWGDAGQGFIASAWGSEADARVETLMRTVYKAGYFSVDDFKPAQRPTAAKVLAGVKLKTGKPCASKASSV
jgi:hypothetical protein